MTREEFLIANTNHDGRSYSTLVVTIPISVMSARLAEQQLMFLRNRSENNIALRQALDKAIEELGAACRPDGVPDDFIKGSSSHNPHASHVLL
jgi:hypothetical protein